MYLIKRTKTAIAVLNTPDITDNKDDHPLQQSSGQSAKIYFEMKFNTDTHTSYSTSKCKLLTDVKESLSTMQSGTCFQTSDLVLPEKKFQTKLGSLVFPEVSVNVFSSLSPISDTVQSSSERCKHTGFLYVQKNYDNVEKELPSFEITGDNIDLMKHPTHMTKENSGRAYIGFSILLYRGESYPHYQMTNLWQRYQEEAMKLDQNLALIQEIHDPLTKNYTCTWLKEYKTLGFFKRHLIKEHNWIFDVPEQDQSQSKTALMLIDTYNAFRMGDGEY